MPRPQVELASLECEDPALTAPAEGILDSHSDLQVRPEPTSDCLELIPLEEPWRGGGSLTFRPRRRLHGHPCYWIPGPRHGRVRQAVELSGRRPHRAREWPVAVQGGVPTGIRTLQGSLGQIAGDEAPGATNGLCA